MRICILFLQALYTSAPKGHFHWSDDDELSEILITKEVPIESDVVHKRPVIVLVRSPVAWQGLGLDQLDSESIKTGARDHVDMLSGNLTFNCLSAVPDEAEVIAWLTASHTWLLRRVLMKLGFHDIGQRMQIGSPTPPGQLVRGSSKSEIVNVPAFTTFQFGWGARVLEEDVPVLRQIETTLVASMLPAFRPTNTIMEGGWGTGLVQVDGSPIEFENMKRPIRSPTVRGRPATVTQVLGNDPSPLTQRIIIDDKG